MEGGKEARGSERDGTGITRGSCFSVLIVTGSPEADWKVTGFPEADWIVKEEVGAGANSGLLLSGPFWIVMPGGSF